MSVLVPSASHADLSDFNCECAIIVVIKTVAFTLTWILSVIYSTCFFMSGLLLEGSLNFLFGKTLLAGQEVKENVSIGLLDISNNKTCL